MRQDGFNRSIAPNPSTTSWRKSGAENKQAFQSLNRAQSLYNSQQHKFCEAETAVSIAQSRPIPLQLYHALAPR